MCLGPLHHHHHHRHHYLPALQPGVGLGLLHGFETANFSRVGSLGSCPTPTCRTRDNTLYGPYRLTCLGWVALAGAYSPANIALQVTEAHKPLSAIWQ
jgi:hypothetical protein